MEIAADHPAVAGHFPGHPVVPGAVLLDRVNDALARHVGRPVRVTGYPTVKFMAPLTPGQPFEISLTDKHEGRAAFEVSAGGRKLVTGTVTFDGVAV